MALHTLAPEQLTLHAHYAPSLAPALEIDSGDTVECSTLDVSWGMENHTSTTEPRRKFEPRDPVADDGPCLLGPILVRGAKPGDTLEIAIDTLDPGPWGWTLAGAGITPPPLARALGLGDAPMTLVRWEIDRARRLATNQFGHIVALRPFLGMMGVSPPGPGPHSGWTPTIHGGNMDCTALQQGSTLYLPVGVPGALVSIGDGHAAQGDGEIGGTAIECRMDRAALTMTVRTDLRITSPRVHTDSAWVTLGFGPTLDDAMHGAMRAMLDVMAEELGVSRTEALALSGAVVDLRITQVVNGVVGVHAVWRDDALRAGGAGA